MFSDTLLKLFYYLKCLTTLQRFLNEVFDYTREQPKLTDKSYAKISKPFFFVKSIFFTKTKKKPVPQLWQYL